MANKEPYWVQTRKDGLIRYSDNSLRDENWKIVAMPLKKVIDKNPNKEKSVIRKKLQPIEKKSSKDKFVWWWAWAAAVRWARAARKALKK